MGTSLHDRLVPVGVCYLADCGYKFTRQAGVCHDRLVSVGVCYLADCGYKFTRQAGVCRSVLPC